jgi:hypothetical protein
MERVVGVIEERARPGIDLIAAGGGERRRPEPALGLRLEGEGGLGRRRAGDVDGVGGDLAVGAVGELDLVAAALGVEGERAKQVPLAAVNYRYDIAVVEKRHD